MYKQTQILFILFLNVFLFVNAFAVGELKELQDKLTAPYFKAEKDGQTVVLFGTVHALPLGVLTNHTQIKEEITNCDALFVENNHRLPFYETDKYIPVQLSIETERRIKTVLQHYGFTKRVGAYDLYSQVLALNFYPYIKGMDCELIEIFETDRHGPIFSLDEPETRLAQENALLDEFEPEIERTPIAMERALNKIYVQALGEDPQDSFKEDFEDFEDICKKLIKEIPFEYEEPDPDHTRERTHKWIKNSLEPYLAAHERTKIAIVVGALHLEDLIDWLLQKGFNGTIIHSDL